MIFLTRVREIAQIEVSIFRPGINFECSEHLGYRPPVLLGHVYTFPNLLDLSGRMTFFFVLASRVFYGRLPDPLTSPMRDSIASTARLPVLRTNPILPSRRARWQDPIWSCTTSYLYSTMVVVFVIHLNLRLPNGGRHFTVENEL